MSAQAEMFGVSLADARAEFFRKAQAKITPCPCCDKPGKVYHRKFNAGMARALIYVYKWQATASPHDWLNVCHHLRAIGAAECNNYGTTLHWGLMSKRETEPEHGGKSTGLYRLTMTGVEFVQNRRRIHSHVHEYRNTAQYFDGDKINIAQALGKHFNYRELMREPGRLA